MTNQRHFQSVNLNSRPDFSDFLGLYFLLERDTAESAFSPFVAAGGADMKVLVAVGAVVPF